MAERREVFHPARRRTAASPKELATTLLQQIMNDQSGADDKEYNLTPGFECSDLIIVAHKAAFFITLESRPRVLPRPRTHPASRSVV